MYVYKVYDKLKIYRPLAIKKEKWIGNTTKNYILGYKQLPEQGDLLIITKSLKDVMCLKSLGYNSISPSSEGTLLPEIVIKDLSNRFKQLIVLFDNDTQGIKSAQKIKTIYNINNITIPLDLEVKDISEYYNKFKNQTINFLQNELSKQNIL